jgi:hypothetical protein
MPEPQGYKRCAKCGVVKNLWQFPKDSSRHDARWHSCRACNREYWRRRGRFLALRRKYNVSSRSGLGGLRRFGHGGPRFGSLPPNLRVVAQRLLSGYLAKHAHRMTPPLYAALHASATSHAPQVGSRSWARRMWRLKGWRRQERRQAAQDARLTEIRTRNAGKPRVNFRGLDGV